MSKQIDLNKLCFLPGALLPLKDGKYNYISLLKQGLTNLGVTFPSSGGGTPSLTATQIAYGDGSNLMTSSSDFVVDNSGGAGLLKLGINVVPAASLDIIGDINQDGGGTKGVTMANGTAGLAITPNAKAVIIGDINTIGNGGTFSIDNFSNNAYYNNSANDGKFGINTSTPSVALDVVGESYFNTPISETAFQIVENSGNTVPLVINTSDKYIKFDQNDDGYKVGIGTSTPSDRLDVVGSIKFESLAEYANNAAAISGGLSAGNLYYTDVAGDGVLKIVI